MASQTFTAAPTDGLGRLPDAREAGLVDLDGRRFYRITSYDDLPPFFMTLVGASDLWLFISSTGGVTAGREEADRALFPYATEDKVAAGAGRTGGLTLLRVGTVFWQPLAPRRPGDPHVERNLYKDPLGTTLVFEETRADLGLRVRVSWRTAARFGVVREVEVASTTDRQVRAEVLDGFVDLLPAGVTVQTQGELSSLLDAYKRAEVDAATGLGLVYLNSTLTDKADPSESLSTTVAWQVGLDDVDHLLSTRQVGAFSTGRPVAAEREVRGEKGAYLVRAHLTLAPGEQRRWSVVADVDQSAADVVRLQTLLADPVAAAAALAADVEGTRAHLDRLVGTADAAQVTGDELATAHHRANVLFNVMRGGVLVDGYTVRTADLRAFVGQRSPRTAARHRRVVRRARGDRAARRPRRAGRRVRRPGPAAARARVPAADVQPPARRPEPAVEQVHDRPDRRATARRSSTSRATGATSSRTGRRWPGRSRSTPSRWSPCSSTRRRPTGTTRTASRAPASTGRCPSRRTRGRTSATGATTR